MRMTLEELKKRYPSYTEEQKEEIEARYQAAVSGLGSQIVVLDDDPTGTQTVHDIYVYTAAPETDCGIPGWGTAEMTEDLMRRGFQDEHGMFYVLTNSRSFSEEKTEQVHRQIAKSLAAVSKEQGKDFLLISRGDSTLRGHYPLETDTLRAALEEEGASAVDGLILCPFFPEGGRLTAGDVHYCLEGETAVPAGETEFAKDTTFGFQASDLKEYIAEKSLGRYPADEVLCIELEELRGMQYEQIERKLCDAEGFRQIVVNALEYADLKVFAIALAGALEKGKHFLIRSAAAVPKVLGGVTEQGFLGREKLLENAGKGANGGLVVVGSHVKKTNQQLEELRKLPEVEFLEFSTEHAAEEGALEAETKRAVREVERVIRTGRTAVLYTSRKLVLPEGGSKEEALRISVRISEALTDVVCALEEEPAFILAKGGITSSDVAVRGLGIRKALVMGQADKGIPVWRQGAEAKFPGRPYIIFPGNVGTEKTLGDLVKRIV
ncbi:MAG: four-carbon acid sugar kinase family protein [Eubacteriales bacterium]|nr:four-carbon acid sugar kinase family protein [Eubacteriales bacterium]